MIRSLTITIAVLAAGLRLTSGKFSSYGTYLSETLSVWVYQRREADIGTLKPCKLGTLSKPKKSHFIVS